MKIKQLLDAQAPLRKHNYQLIVFVLSLSSVKVLIGDYLFGAEEEGSITKACATDY